MRNVGAILLVLALLVVFMLAGMVRPADAPQVKSSADLGPFPGGTGTPVLVFPLLYLMPTPTPTITPTPTTTPSPMPATATRTGVPGATGLDGRVVMQKARYYTHIEWIWFWEQIYNPTGNPIAYTILGINVWKDNPFLPDTNLGFHTSWTGSPDWVLSGCWGPGGNTDWNLGHNFRCAPNQNEGWHEDHIGASSNLEIHDPGRYRVEFWACLSSFDSCTSDHAGPPDWRKLGPDAFFDADPAPSGAQAAANTPMPQTTCFLITDDPSNVYLKCGE